MTSTTVLTSWARANGSYASPVEEAKALLGEFVADFDSDAFARDYVAEINAALPEGLVVTESGDVYGPYGYAGDATQDVRAAADGVDLDELLSRHDQRAD